MNDNKGLSKAFQLAYRAPLCPYLAATTDNNLLHSASMTLFILLINVLPNTDLEQPI